MASSTIVLITGANRGIGRGILEIYIKRPNHVVLAAVRDPSLANSQELLALPRGTGTVIHVLKIDATSESDAAEAVRKLQQQHGITHIDILFANAAIAFATPKVSELKIEDSKAHFEPNVYGVVRLYQATLPLLRKATAPKWISVGSRAGYLNNFLEWPNSAYGPTKVVLHWLTRAMHQEEPELTAFVVDPGAVASDMGNRGARKLAQKLGLDELPIALITVNDSAEGFAKIVDAATRETHSGKLWTWEGEHVPW